MFYYKKRQIMCKINRKTNVIKPTVILFTAVLLFSTFIPETGPSVLSSENPISVFVSIEPQVTFVERIGGNRVTVHALVLPGENPATYSPAPEQMTVLSKSKLFFRIGVPFEESLIKRIENVAKQVQIVDTRKGIHLRKMEGLDEDYHSSNGDDVSHDHGGYDPHIWLSPILVQKQAKTICEALISIDPEGAHIYEANLRKFIHDLDDLHQKIKRSLAPVKGGTIFVFHPSFGYLADTYGLKQKAVESEGKTPKGKNLSQFIKMAKREKVRVVFVQPQFDQNAARKIASAIDGVVVSLDPLSKEYFKNMEAMADTIASALKK